MTFTEPSLSIPDLPIVSGPINTLLGATNTQQFPPIIQTLPRAQAALQQHQTQLTPLYSQFSPQVQAAVFGLQQQRALKGQNPLSPEQTLSALKAAATSQIQTPPAQDTPWSLGSLWHNSVSDLFDIGRSLPRLPLAAINEVRSLPQLPGAISQAAQSGNPLDAIAAISRAPGVRFIPGSFTLGNLASGDLNVIGQHPLMTALDVLPAASKIAAGTEVGKLAEEAGMNPLRGVATRRATVDEAGNPVLVPGRVGAVTDALGQTRPGQLLRETFGQQARQTASMAELQNIELRRRVNPESTFQGTDPELSAIGRATTQLAHDSSTIYKVDAARHPAVLEAFQTGDTSMLADNELAFYSAAKDTASQLTQYKLNNSLLVDRDGHYYLPEQGTRLLAADTRFSNRKSTIQLDTIPRLERAAVNDPRVQVLRDTLVDALNPSSPTSFGDALRLFNNLTKQKVRFGIAGTTGEAATKGETTLAAIANIRQSLRDVLAAERKVQRLDQEILPASVVPLVQRQVEQALVDRYATGSDAAAITQAIMERNFDAIPDFSVKYLRGLQDSVARSWRAIEATAPEPPIFIHQVSPARAAILDFPRISDRETAVTSLRQRTLDYTPYVRDVTVGLRHESIELLRLQGEQAAAKDILTMYGRRLYHEGEPGTEGFYPGMLQEYMPHARLLAANNPRLDVQSVAAQLMYREYIPYNPEAFAPYATPQALGIPNPTHNPIMIPKVVANTMERMFGGERIGPIAQLFSPIMKVFRTSVLPLSPRWHVNNILGGAIMLMAQTDPITVWKFLGEARQMSRDIHLLEGTDAIPRELALRLGQRDINKEISLRDELNVRAGYTQGRIFRQIQEAKSLGKVKDAFGNIVNKSYDFNGHVDDMYRSMAYLYGFDKALTKGMTREAAQTAGIELLKKTMITWDNATPIERSIIRNIMPFYGFTSHMMRYVMGYPGDHPVRASVLAQVARTELEDQGSGLPSAFLNAFFFGSPDAKGNQSAINLSAVNPFATIANNFQLAGFVSGLNPGLSTILQSLGVDTSRGAPELYPQLAYDPDTGKLTAETSNPILGLIQNTLPQSRLLSELMGSSSEFKALLRTNPEGAKRLIQSQLGLPVIYRSYNTPQEIAKSEVTRMTDQQTVLNTALRTGDYSDAAKYPGLTALIAQIHQLQQQGTFDQFTPQTIQPSNPALLFQSSLNTFGQ